MYRRHNAKICQKNNVQVFLELGTKSLFRYSVTVIRYSLLLFVSNDHALESMSNDVMSNYLVLYI